MNTRNILKHKIDEFNNITADEEAWKLVIPHEKRELILAENHNDPLAGHQGIEKTFQRIAQSYYWPKMRSDVESYVAGCYTCQKCKVEQKGQVGLMGTREITRPWRAIGIGLMGEFSRSKNGFKYLMVFEDVFTRFIICVPIRKKTGEAVVNALEKIICANYGTPERVILDNGREFINKDFKEFIETAGINHEWTPAYHPQSHPVEVTPQSNPVNRVLKTMKAAYIENNHKEWDKYIHNFQFAHNTSVHKTTGKSPAFLVFNRELKPPKFWRRLAGFSKESNPQNETNKENSKAEREINEQNDVIINPQPSAERLENWTRMYAKI